MYNINIDEGQKKWLERSHVLLTSSKLKTVKKLKIQTQSRYEYPMSVSGFNQSKWP